MSKKRDDLASILVNEVNKEIDVGYDSIHFLEDDTITATDVVDWIPTGCDMLDLAISNRKNGGIPCGKIIEIEGLESCVDENTIITVIIEMNSIKIPIKDVKTLLDSGKIVKVKTVNGEFTKIKKYIDKGMLKSYKVSLDNGNTINTSADHLFFTSCGWMKTKDLLINKTQILCENDELNENGYYSTVKSIEFQGIKKIVDISVEHPEQCYYGNGMLNHNTGKTLIASHILANTQKRGGIGVFIDVEKSLDKKFLKVIGVDTSRLLHVDLDTVEDAFNCIESIMTKYRASNKDQLICIVLDSVAALSTKEEMAEDYVQTGYGTNKARLLSRSLRKITGLIARQRIGFVVTNQLRQKLNAAPFGEKYVAPGGMAMNFHTTVKMRLESIKKLKDKNKDVIGNQTRVTVIKNRVGPPYRKAEFPIFFDRGIDNFESYLSYCQKYNLLKKDGTWKEIVDHNGDEWKFQSKEWSERLEIDEEFRNFVYDKITDVAIMKYKIDETGQNGKVSEDIEAEKVIEKEEDGQ